MKCKPRPKPPKVWQEGNTYTAVYDWKEAECWLCGGWDDQTSPVLCRPCASLEGSIRAGTVRRFLMLQWKLNR